MQQFVRVVTRDITRLAEFTYLNVFLVPTPTQGAPERIIHLCPVWSNQELPEQAYLHPPLTVFVVEQRAFGRLALVGSHAVQSLMHYAPPELGEEPEEEEEEPKPKGNSHR